MIERIVGNELVVLGVVAAIVVGLTLRNLFRRGREILDHGVLNTIKDKVNDYKSAHDKVDPEDIVNADASAKAESGDLPAVIDAELVEPEPEPPAPAPDGEPMFSDSVRMTPVHRPEEPEPELTLAQRASNFGRRLLRIGIVFVVGVALSYFFMSDIVHYISSTAGKLYYLKPTEAFVTYFKIAVTGGFLLSLPFLFYELWQLILPALDHRQRKIVGLLVPASVLLFLGGLAFAFFLVLPPAMKFFMGIGNDDLMSLFSVGQYFDFILAFVLPFGLVFELPLFMLVAATFGLLSSRFCANHRKAVVLLAFVLGALISPLSDVLTQVAIAVPLIALWELGALGIRLLVKA